MPIESKMSDPVLVGQFVHCQSAWSRRDCTSASDDVMRHAISHRVYPFEKFSC